jgi:hypothetical protein
MQIPKQPRTKSPSVEAAPQREASPGGAAPKADDVNQHLQQAYASYVENINSANLRAQLEHAKTYLAYVERLQQEAQLGSNPLLDYYKEVVQAYDDKQASADAHKKFALASIERHAAAQKAVTDAATAYAQKAREISEKLQSEVGQHCNEMAESLKDALVNVNVSTAHVPALSLLYQSLRTMSAPAAGGRGG